MMALLSSVSQSVSQSVSPRESESPFSQSRSPLLFPPLVVWLNFAAAVRRLRRPRRSHAASAESVTVNLHWYRR